MESAVATVYIGNNHFVSSLNRSILNNVEGFSIYTPIQRLVINSLDIVEKESGVSLNHKRTAVIISTTKGDVELITSNFEESYLWRISDCVKKHFNCKNSPKIISTACISGIAAVTYASRMIEDGEMDNVFVVGVDAINEFVIEGFNSFKSVSPTICRPYDKSRDGITIGEGCGVILLTNDESKSQSKIVVAGCGLSNDANHISGPSRDGSGLSLAIENAMKDAKIKSEDVDYVNLHGTGTLFNDEMESKAIALSHLSKTPCNSLKPYIGHTFGASGIIELIMVAQQMQDGVVLGVKGFKELGTPFELNVSANDRKVEINCAIKTASGFGGTNGAIVLLKSQVVKKQQNQTQIEEIGQIEIDSSNISIPFANYIKDEYKKLNNANIKFFKMDSLSKLGYIASCKLLGDLELNLLPERVAIVLANKSASLDTDLKHQAIVEQKLPEGASPAVFVYTLPNIVAGEIAIKHKFKSELLFFVNEQKNMEALKKYAQKIINRDVCDAVLYGWCELLGENYNVELRLIKRK